MPEEKEVIDWSLFGAVLRHMRIEAGFKTAEEFAEVITKSTNYPVSKETIYKIEGGRQEPKLGLYLAIKRALSPYIEPEYDKALKISVCNDWQYPLSDVLSDVRFDELFKNYIAE